MTVLVTASWALNAAVAEPTQCLHRTLDLVIDASSILDGITSCKHAAIVDKNDTPLQDDFTTTLVNYILRHRIPGSSEIIVKLILPSKAGFCVRSDFLERRLDGYQHISHVQGFLTPRQEIKAPSFERQQATTAATSARGLHHLLQHVTGAIHVPTMQRLGDLEKELANRLSFPWISPVAIPEKRIVWVKGYEDLESGRRIWEAAYALGIKVVIIDQEGSWAQRDDPRWNHLREAFIPTSIAADAGFTDRIVAAVRSYDKPVDALVTIYNAGCVAIARACEILGLWTSPPESFIIAGDKYKSRELELDNGEAFKVSSVDALYARLQSKDHEPVNYPLIVKPCMGWGSECVAKVQNEEQLVEAVARASGRHEAGPNPRTDVMVEPYIDGPEVDANFVLIDGEVAFFEMADDFPKLGDNATDPADGSFLETSMVLPTGLSCEEIEVTKNSVHQTLLRQGFRTGVYHCEGRIRYSSKAYDTRDGLTNLYPNDKHDSQKKPSFYLHEVNARPGGYFVSSATMLTYGVDYYGIHILSHLGDLDRARALSVPYANGAQWWLEVVVMHEDKPGVMKTEDSGKLLLDTYPDIRAAVADYKTHRKKGERLYGPTATLFSYLAYFSVVSRESREDCLRMAQKVRDKFTYEIE